MKRTCFLTALLACMAWSQAGAQVPQVINYQARLLDGTNLFNGNLHLSFNLYNAAVGGDLKCVDEPLTSTVVVDGHYTAVIGSNPVLGSMVEALSQPEIWLETVINGTPMSPRERLRSVAYAAHAWGLSGNAGTVTGLTFLGTTDDIPLEIKVSNERAAFLMADKNFWGYAPKLVIGSTANMIGTNCPGATIAGGGVLNHPNQIEPNANFAFVGAGLGNAIRMEGKSSFIGAGFHNEIQGSSDCVLGGGFQNSIQSNSPSSFLAGGTDNSIGPAAPYSTLGGGQNNHIMSNAYKSVLAGGYGNRIEPSAFFATISGGQGNRIRTNADNTVIAGGWDNSIGTSATFAVVGGGSLNSASGVSSVVAGGYHNTAGAHDSAVGGGVDNAATGFRSTIPGGFANLAGGSYSFAAGRRAKARHDGSLVWADATDADFSSSSSNQFLIRATGGFGVSVTNPAYQADFGGRIRVRQDTAGNMPGIWFYQGTTPNDRAFVGMSTEGYAGLYGSAGANWSLLMNVTNGNIGIGGEIPNGTNKLVVAGGAYCSGTAWVNASDRNLKDGFLPVDAVTVLEKVSQLPVSTWHYKSEGADIRHMGPTAQDFRAAFGLGYNDTSIATIDENGVALAAIQALHAQVGGLQHENAELRVQLDQLSKRLGALESK